MHGPSMNRLGDLLTQALSIALAVACLAFAGYKVVKLRGMENPPPDMGLNFPPPKRRIITDEPVPADPLTTGTLAPVSDQGNWRPQQGYVEETPIQEYRLLTVIDGIAFVEVRRPQGRDILPLTMGARLPGAGTVERIERTGGRWTLVAGKIRLTAERR